MQVFPSSVVEGEAVGDGGMPPPPFDAHNSAGTSSGEEQPISRHMAGYHDAVIEVQEGGNTRTFNRQPHPPPGVEGGGVGGGVGGKGHLIIFDARPKEVAVANLVVGGGYEIGERYKNIGKSKADQPCTHARTAITRLYTAAATPAMFSPSPARTRARSKTCLVC